MSSFWSHVKSFFGGIEHANWAHVAQTTLALAGPPAILILQETVGGDATSQAQSVITEVQHDLATAAKLLSLIQSGDGSVKGELVATLNAVQANLNEILADAHVKDSANTAKITALVNALSQEISVVLSEIP